MEKDILKQIIEAETREDFKKIIEKLQVELFNAGRKIYHVSDFGTDEEKDNAYRELCDVNATLEIAMRVYSVKIEGKEM